MDVKQYREQQATKVEMTEDPVVSGASVAAQHDPFHDFVSRTEQRLDVPNGFLFGLMKEPTDWAFCVQLHAVLESAVNAALHKAIRQPKLDREVAKLGIKTKLKMAEAVGLLKSEFANIVDALGGLRNPVAHQVANIPGFSIEEYFPRLTESQRSRLVGSLQVDPGELRFVIFVRALGVLFTLQEGEAEMDKKFHQELDAAILERDEPLKAAILGLLNAAPSSEVPPPEGLSTAQAEKPA